MVEDEGIIKEFVEEQSKIGWRHVFRIQWGWDPKIPTDARIPRRVFVFFFNVKLDQIIFAANSIF